MPVPARLAVALGLLAIASPARPEPDGRAVAAPVERIVANANRRPRRPARATGSSPSTSSSAPARSAPTQTMAPGVEVQAFGEAGRSLQIPGPLIRVPEGTSSRPRSGTGCATRPSSCTVSRPELPGQRPVSTTAFASPPGATRKVRFEAGRAGTYYYWGSTTKGKGVEDRPVDR